MTPPRLLLISSSMVHGSGYLDHCEAELRSFLPPAARVLFVPHALHDRDRYADRACGRLAAMGFEARSLHRVADPAGAVLEAGAVFIGGGNTFRLLDTLWRLALIEPLRRRVAAGMPYIGSSAGTNVACLSIRTTNDMPIVQPPTFEALGLVPFNINPHYVPPDPASTHMGETRDDRIREFHEENAPPVLGLREGAMLRREGSGLRLAGIAGARLFIRGEAPLDLETGADLAFLLR